MTEKPNINYIKELAGNDAAFEQKFVDIIKEEFPQEVAIYLSHLQNDMLRAASEDVHKLKHKINILGLEQSYEIAARYEEELREGNAKSQSEFTDILKTMETYIKTL